MPSGGAGEERDVMDGAALITAERLRQIEQEGWTPEHGRSSALTHAIEVVWCNREIHQGQLHLEAAGSGRVDDVPTPGLSEVQPLTAAACIALSGATTRGSAELGKSRPLGPDCASGSGGPL